jgi:hypothetical protein
MYLLFITVSLCLVYFVFCFLYPYFFRQPISPLKPRIFISLAIIIAVSVLVHLISFNITNQEISNRLLHGLGGGFLGYLICFLVVRDGKLNITKFQFFVFSFLLVTALGVGNEIIEFIIQNHLHLIFAPNINDTWLDLVSNTVGTLFGAVLFTPFIKR